MELLQLLMSRLHLERSGFNWSEDGTHAFMYFESSHGDPTPELELKTAGDTKLK